MTGIATIAVALLLLAAGCAYLATAFRSAERELRRRREELEPW